MSKYLANRGHNVTVFSFTGSHYLLLKKSVEIIDEEVHEGVKFKWFRSIQFKNQSFPIRIFNWYRFNQRLKSFYNNYTGASPDSIVYSIPALHQVRLLPLSKKLFPSARHIFEIQDIWPLSVQQLGGYSQHNLIIRRMKQAEKIAFNNADEVIAVQPGIHQYVKDEFSEFTINNVHFIPHAFTPEKIQESEKNEYDIGYAGTISRANDLETLINALWCLKKENQFEPKVLIIGTGVLLNGIKKLASGLENVFFKSWMPRDFTLLELQKCRVCYDGLQDLEMYKYGFSRLKWIDYMMLSKPILASYSGQEIDVPIEKIGWRVPAQRPVDLASIIRRILSDENKAQLSDKGQQGFRFLTQNRSIEKLGLEYEQILLDLQS
ncbi:MAG: glycosyltransferase family 4 protein [Bacteroidia bacterium]